MHHRDVLVMSLIAVLAGCYRASSPLPVVGTLERDRIELVAEADEPIAEILLLEGARLAGGDLILRQDSATTDARLAQAAAARKRAEERLAELERGPRRERIQEARARVEGARENLAAQRREHERVSALLERRLASASDLDRAYAQRELAEAAYEEAQALLAELEEGTTVEELGQARAALAEAQAAERVIEIGAERLAVRAPRAGVLEALPYELGERPAKGATVAVMLSDAAPYARVYIPEPIRAQIAPGLEAVVSVDGAARRYTARVRFIASEAAFTPYFALTQRDRSRLSYLAEIVLTEPEALALPSGVPVEVNFPTLAGEE